MLGWIKRNVTVSDYNLRAHLFQLRGELSLIFVAQTVSLRPANCHSVFAN